MNPPYGSALVTKQLVALAFEIAAPSVEMLLLQSKRPGPNFVHIVVLNPYDVKASDERRERAEDPQIPETYNVLGERTFGPAPEDRKSWKRRYDTIAMSKALISQSTGQTSGYVATRMPALLQPGDVHFAGSDNTWGVPVGGSGVESEIDEGASRIVAATIDVLVKQSLKELDEEGVIYL